MNAFKYLLRFEDENGNIHYGEAGGPGSEGDFLQQKLKTYSGKTPWDPDFQLSDKTATIAKILSPLATTPIIHGVGLNYKAHAEEGNLKLPPFPILFVKYPDALANPYDDIPVHKEAWQLDYEAELCVIIGKECKDIPASKDPLDYVLGYSIGNDISSRYWQDKTRSSGQHGYGKSMDKFAPIGPVIVSRHVMTDSSSLKILTHVNGAVRQDSTTASMIFDVPALIRHLSRGITLRPGTIIMTGTPDGVAAFMKPSPWLKDGDVVEIEISGIGKIRNRMSFEDENSQPPDDRPPGF
ncbi:hypothetical protein LTR84_003206 [Exophiala bonariae]|uniref:Fumarylacetoacetase-like C-terminal domain-containing protein n=1 Tax=Exophiala bonariae TaxID=1690606 RepID=A0AAV9NAW4_9EURO|nr:hypothetical protein LTR84_003206 [Exophiala bonariae]